MKTIRCPPQLLVLVLVLVPLGGCAVTREEPMPFSDARDSIPESEVRFYDRVPRGASPVARIETTTLRFASDPAEALGAARRELVRQAAAIGANGIVLDAPLGEAADAEELYATEILGLAIFVPTPP